MSIFNVLICVVSLALQSLLAFNIHNWCQDIDLIYPVYFIYGGKWQVIPDQEIDASTIMRNRIEFDSGQDILEGALIYRIQRRQHAESNEFIQNEPKSVQLLIAWHVEHAKELHVRAVLVEHGWKLDEDKLRRLHQKYWHSLKAQVDPIGSDWLVDDETVLKTTFKVMNGGYRWDIFISEGMKNNAMRLLWIDAGR
jgi:hypothetical protein